MLLYINNKELQSLSNSTCLGAIMNYITTADETDFQPMNANYGIIKNSGEKDKVQKKTNILNNSLKEIKEFKEKLYGKLI